MERLRGSPSISPTLTGITAAVGGVITNLAAYFTLRTRFDSTTTVHAGLLHVELPNLTGLRPVALAIAVAAALMLFTLRWSVLRTLGACALLGVIGSLTAQALG
jgi:chromate transporter